MQMEIRIIYSIFFLTTYKFYFYIISTEHDSSGIVNKRNLRTENLLQYFQLLWINCSHNSKQDDKKLTASPYLFNKKQHNVVMFK